jgi:serine protease AprX
VRNPDVVAPGVHVQSLRDPGSTLDNEFGALATMIDPRFFRGSGTSQAAAFVSGAAALLLQANSKLTPDQVKWVLTSTAQNLPAAAAQAQGHGLVRLTPSYGRPPTSAQPFKASTGTGTIEGARGSLHLAITDLSTGITRDLVGERDIFGAPVSTSTLASAESKASAWSGATFNGTIWTGSGWTSTSWASSSWASTYWKSTSWASTGWASTSWKTDNWASTSWASSSWANSAWESESWD